MTQQYGCGSKIYGVYMWGGLTYPIHIYVKFHNFKNLSQIRISQIYIVGIEHSDTISRLSFFRVLILNESLIELIAESILYGNFFTNRLIMERFWSVNNVATKSISQRSIIHHNWSIDWINRYRVSFELVCNNADFGVLNEDHPTRVTASTVHRHRMSH